MPRPQNEKENLQFIQELAEVDGPFESPININFLDLTKLELPPLCWNRSDAVPKKMKLTNSGHTVILSGRWNRERPYLTGGPLEGNYVFSQVHFHWGPDNCRGSEHTVCGEKFPLEMHVAHFKTEYSTQECALQEKDGMVVVVYLFKLQDEPNASLKRLISALPCIQEANTSVAMDPKPLIALCNTFTEDYFTYWGSVVTSTCAHILMWIISREPFGISRDQMDEFRKIMDCTQRPILRNNRDTQPLHGRNVFHVNPSRFLDKPLLPIKKIMGCFCSDVTEQKETGDSKRRSSSRGCCCSNNNNNDGSNHKESTDSKDIKDSHHSSNHDHNSTNINNNNKPQRSQEEIEGKDVKSTRFSDQTSGVNNKQMVYVQHATIHSNPVFKKQLYNGDCDAIPEEKREDSDLKEKEDEVSHSCCFLPVKKEPKDYEKESRKEKADKNRDNKKSFDSVKALSNIINSLEALKDHTYKKLQELECISMEIKELKTYCVEPSEQRWLRKIEKIITRQKRYTLRTSRCCFSEVKKLAKEYNIDKVLDRKMILSTEDGKNFPTEENDFQEEEKSEQIDNQSPLPNYSTCKQEKFSKKAQKLIKSFFEDIQESEKTQKTVQKDLEVRRASKWKLDDEMKTQASSAAGSKVYITQTMFKLGDFGNRFFTEITPGKNKEVVAKKDNKKENNGMPCKKEKRSKIIPLHRTDVVFRFKNKPKLKKCSSSSSALISSESEIRMVKKKKSKKSGKKKTKNAIEPVKKKNAKTQYVSLSSEETTEAEMQIPVVSKRKSRKDIWENQSVISLEPDVSSSEKKKNICEKRPKGKLNNVKQEMSKRSMKMVLEQNEILREKNLLKTEREFEKSPKSPERKKLKLIQKENNMKPLIVCKAEDLNLVEKSVMTDDNQIHTPKEMGDSLRATDVLIQTENESGKSKEMSTADEVSKKSWPTPLPRSRDSSSDKKQIMPFPRFYDNCMQRRATSPVIIYHSANKQNVEGSKSYRYEIHNHENPAQTFLENSTVESERPIIEKNNFLGKELKDQEVHRETDSNDSNYEKISKAAKSDVTILSLRSSENEEIRKDGKNRTMSAESFSTSKTIYQKKRRQRQSRKTHKTPSTVKILDTIESSRLEFSNLTEDEQLQIISANVASFVKQKLLEHKRNMESKETSGPISLGEVEQALLKELKTKIAGPKIEENVPDVPHELENRWSTAVLNVPSEKNIQTAEPKEQVKIEPAPALKPEKIEPVASKPVHNFIKKNKLLAGKYKRKIPAKKADGPKKMIKPPKTISTEPTSSDSKSPVRVLRPHVCNPVVIAPQEKRRDRSASVQKPTSNPVKSPSTPKESNSKRPASSKDFPKQQPTVPPVVKKIPKPSKRWIPTYTLTSYLQTPLEVAGSQRMKFLCDKEDKVENLDLNTSDLEYLIKLEMCINNEIAANMENSMNYVKTLLSQDYNGSAIIEKPPIKDSFNIFDPINNNNNGILLIELHDSGNNVTDYETSESRNFSKKISKLRRKRRRIKKKWSDLNRLQESGDKTVYDSDYNSNSSDLDTKRSEKSETDNKDVSDILKTYIYHLGRGEESNINLTEKCDPPTEEETVIISKPQIKKRNEKPLLSSEMKEKLLEVLTEEMKQEIENQEKFMTASSQDCSSVATEETMTSCERTEMWTKMLKEFLEENNKDVSNKDPDNDESDVKKSEDNISRSYDD